MPRGAGRAILPAAVGEAVAARLPKGIMSRMADETGTPGDDVVQQDGGRWRLPDWHPSRGAQVFAAVALVIGLAAGYAVGSSAGHGGTARPRPAATATASPFASAPAGSFRFTASSALPALTQDIGACSVQTGKDDLEIGIQLTNQSTQPLTLTTARSVDATGSLKQLTWQWGTCGALANGFGQGVNILLPGESTWLAVTFQVKVACPGPHQLQFSVRYLVRGHTVTAHLPGIVDVGEIPYSGCARHS